MILDLFSAKPDHPLADARELRRIIAELPLDNAYKAVDEVVGWLDSLQNPEGFKLEHLFETVRQLDNAAQPHLRRLARDYLNSPRLSKTEEKRLWATSNQFWLLLGQLYSICLERYRHKEKGSAALKPHLALIFARLIQARGTQLKWRQYHYAPVDNALWQLLGAAFLLAQAEGVADIQQALYPGQVSLSSPTLEYLKVLVLHASSMDSLLPLEIELAERLIAHCLSQFSLTRQSTPESVYWIDPAQATPPVRLLRQPKPSPTLHFFAPGRAMETLQELIAKTKAEGLPADLNLGGQYPPRIVLPVLEHLAMYWSPTPPVREHKRHQVKSLLTVVNGYDNITQVFGGNQAAEAATESWIADNVSLGGFGAQVTNIRGDWLRVGALLAMQPEGGDNWLLGVVRRYGRETETQAAVGIQTLARQAVAVSLRSLGGTSYTTTKVAGILLRDSVSDGEVRLVMPPATFDRHSSLECVVDGQTLRLRPMDIQESGTDYEIARYQESSGQD